MPIQRSQIQVSGFYIQDQAFHVDICLKNNRRQTDDPCVGIKINAKHNTIDISYADASGVLSKSIIEADLQDLAKTLHQLETQRNKENAS